eukprot:gene37156-48550_t
MGNGIHRAGRTPRRVGDECYTAARAESSRPGAGALGAGDWLQPVAPWRLPTLLLGVVARACKGISHAVNKGALGGVLGSAGSANVQGEVQKKLDIIANDVLIEANEWGGHLAAMASEEMDTIHAVPNRYPQGEYLLLFDPLDGSSNIDVNVSIGTIFSVLKKADASATVSESDFLQ